MRNKVASACYFVSSKVTVVKSKVPQFKFYLQIFKKNITLYKFCLLFLALSNKILCFFFTKNTDVVWYFYCKTRQKYWWRKWFGSAPFIRNWNRDDLQLWGKTSDMYERQINSKRQRRAHDQSTVKKRTIQICIALE